MACCYINYNGRRQKDASDECGDREQTSGGQIDLPENLVNYDNHFQERLKTALLLQIRSFRAYATGKLKSSRVADSSYGRGQHYR